MKPVSPASASVLPAAASLLELTVYRGRGTWGCGDRQDHVSRQTILRNKVFAKTESVQ